MSHPHHHASHHHATYHAHATASTLGMSRYGNPFVAFTAWSDQGASVYGTNLDEEPFSYYAVSIDSNPAIMPVWSPDGSQIAFLHYDRNRDRFNFVVYDVFRGEVSQTSQHPMDFRGSFCWTYDMRYLVWSDVQPDGTELDVYRLDVETDELVNLTQDLPVWDAFPACSPVSDQIAFVSDRAEGNMENDNIWVMDSQGENLRQLTDTPGWENKFPAWSADGTQIAYYHIGFGRMSDAAYAPAGVYVMNADGSENRLLVENDQLFSGVVEAPHWSPDGRCLAYPVGRDDTTIYVVSTEDGALVWQSSLPGENKELSWSANSAYLLFTNELDDVSQIYITDISDPKSVPMLPYPDCFLAAFCTIISLSQRLLHCRSLQLLLLRRAFPFSASESRSG